MWRMSVAWAPAVLAAAVGISRTQDYWHHWEDVCAGAVIGLCTAALAYVQKRPTCGGGGGRGSHYTPHLHVAERPHDKGEKEGEESDSPETSQAHGSVGGFGVLGMVGGGRAEHTNTGGVRGRSPSLHHETADLGSNM